MLRLTLKIDNRRLSSNLISLNTDEMVGRITAPREVSWPPPSEPCLCLIADLGFLSGFEEEDDAPQERDETPAAESVR